MHGKRASRFGAGLVAAVLLTAAPPHGSRAREPEPSRLVDLVAALSEPAGYFDTDNLVSNEGSYAQIIDQVHAVGGVYIGVGPEQNFNYIARARPSWAFIVDIRRDNLLHHLLLNAVLAQSSTPYHYLCRLFARSPNEEALAAAATDINGVIAAVEASPSSQDVFEQNVAAFTTHIESQLLFTLSVEDRGRLRSMYEAYFREQLELRFRSHGRPRGRHYPSYRSLLLARTPTEKASHFLASDSDFAFVKNLAGSGRLVPVVGDLAGPHALRKLGAWAKSRGETVTTFYASNVEFYLLREGRFDSYVENLRSLPLGDNSLFIRSYFHYGLPHPERQRGHRGTVLLQSIPRFLELYDAGALESYWDVCTVDYLRAPPLP